MKWSYNRDSNSLNMNIHLYGYEEDERTKIIYKKIINKGRKNPFKYKTICIIE